MASSNCCGFLKTPSTLGQHAGNGREGLTAESAGGGLRCVLCTRGMGLMGPFAPCQRQGPMTCKGLRKPSALERSRWTQRLDCGLRCLAAKRRRVFAHSGVGGAFRGTTSGKGEDQHSGPAGLALRICNACEVQVLFCDRGRRGACR